MTVDDVTPNSVRVDWFGERKRDGFGAESLKHAD